MKVVIAAILTLFAHIVYAGDYSLMYGAMGGISRTTVAYSGNAFFGVIESKDSPSSSYVELVPEFGISQYRTTGTVTNQIYFTPKLVYTTGTRFTYDLGIGVSYLDNKQIGNRPLGTNFEFTDHVGVSYRVAYNFQVGYRLNHISNAGIKEPNPGVNSQQLYLTYGF
jgi:hypothetical protein